VASLTLPLAAFWLLLSLRLGRGHPQRAASSGERLAR
jgi:hypothetical protein